MEEKVILIWTILIIGMFGSSEGQKLSFVDLSNTTSGTCKDFYTNNFETLKRLQRCVVIIGNLQIALLEKTTTEDFENISFPYLREVTGYVSIYRVRGLQSIGQLFPNLSRIRGRELLGNYGLIIYDIANLNEIGLYNLVKIDRGGVMISNNPLACFVHTIDWKVIAPRARHVLNTMSKQDYCPISCSCSKDPSLNHCWNNRKCQRYVSDEDVECHEECYGCRKISNKDCLICRHFTYRGSCVPACPKDTLIIPANQYCVTIQECTKLNGWSWNNTCIFHCPIYYKLIFINGSKTCDYCSECPQTCGSQHITTLDSMQKAASCVYINGFLEIHVRAVTEAMEELHMYLRHIQEVTDYIYIYGSLTITSLDFLSSLKRIGGRHLKNDRYSLVVHDMHVLQNLFSRDTLKTLVIEKGTVKIFNNPMLCFGEIETLKKLLPVVPNEIDIPQGMNGYSGTCKEASVRLHVEVKNETSAVVTFSSKNETNSHHTEYTILYVRIPAGNQNTVVPESCSNSEWFAVSVVLNIGSDTTVELNALKSSSTYALCVESYDPLKKILARSPIVHFKTEIGKPAPPFITELVAASEDIIVIRWLDHRDYQAHITHYELDLSIIDITAKDIAARNHCKDLENDEYDLSRHAIIMKPPPEYGTTCKTTCGILSTVVEGAMIQEDFNICENLDKSRGCEYEEYESQDNFTIGNYVQTLKLRINGPRKDYQIGRLAPYRDYRIRLKSCTSLYCSQSSRGVVRTLPSKQGDLVTSTSVVETAEDEITISWEPPDISNGPILAYFVQIMPNRNLYDVAYPVPNTWCVLNNQTSFVINVKKETTYFVRVCTTSLLSLKTCIDWIGVNNEQAFLEERESNSYYWYSAIFTGLLLWFLSVIITRIIKPKPDIEEIPLIENTYIESNNIHL